MNTDKIERKLDYFSAAMKQKIEIEKLKSRTEITRNLRTAERIATETAARNARVFIETKKRELTSAANRQVSRAKVELITRYVTLKKQQTDMLATLVRAHLASFTLSANYEKYLLSQIKAAYSPHFHMVKLSPQDMRFEKAIIANHALLVEEGKPEIIGGFVLLDESSTIMSDHSFETRLLDALKNFRYD